ncbi:uncharacterized protein LOC135610009 isoform X4 [Musa acuminata AAA Group]|uniref:uncharacterized protein LOC135610009 isoform X4 n=1 Tax=Musa acuminata AAA Group TaxID=214697 RepID=UPI0031DAB1EA
MEKSLAWASCGEEEKACVGWIRRYFNDCVCSPSGELSFGLGMISLLCWGIAEIPQIITNFHSKSGHGVSFAFLLTWVIGDIFNLVGCLLEPVTLPTQLYTALLYTATTVVLVLQTLYYDYWVRWWKKRGLQAPLEVEEGSCKRLNPKNEDLSRPLPTLTASRRTSSRVDVYYTSARSLASSGTPPCRSSYLGVGPARSGPSASGYMESSGSDEEGSPRHQSRSSGVSNPKKVVSRSLWNFCSWRSQSTISNQSFNGSTDRISRRKNHAGRRHKIIGREHLWAAVRMDYGGHLHGRPPAPNIFEWIKSSDVLVCTHCQCYLCRKHTLEECRVGKNQG